MARPAILPLANASVASLDLIIAKALGNHFFQPEITVVLPFQKAGKSRSGAQEPPMLPINCFSLTNRSTALIFGRRAWHANQDRFAAISGTSGPLRGKPVRFAPWFV